MEDIQRGGYYFATRHNYESFIIHVKDFDGKYVTVVSGICPGKRTYYQHTNLIVKDEYKFTEATVQQIKHLHACAHESKYVRKPKVSAPTACYPIF